MEHFNAQGFEEFVPTYIHEIVIVCGLVWYSKPWLHDKSKDSSLQWVELNPV